MSTVFVYHPNSISSSSCFCHLNNNKNGGESERWRGTRISIWKFRRAFLFYKRSCKLCAALSPTLCRSSFILFTNLQDIRIMWRICLPFQTSVTVWGFLVFLISFLLIFVEEFLAGRSEHFEVQQVKIDWEKSAYQFSILCSVLNEW